MLEISTLVGGAAGDGIKQAGNAIARVFNRLGYNIFVYEDYPSLIRGGHNFAIIRACSEKILSHKEKIDILIALNQDTIEKHAWRLKENSIVIFDSNSVSTEGIGIPMKEIAKEKNLPLIVRNTVALGALGGILGIDFEIIEDVIRSTIKKKLEENIEVAEKGYEIAEKGKLKIEKIENEVKPLVTGNEAVGLGLVKGGMKLYIAYPMTPASSILHYLAAHEEEFKIATVHPETEIAVIGIAEGAAYAGIRSACGTSGGGFALMVEHLSLAGQAEIPVVIVLSQRPGPATGVPTYTEQGDLFFAMFAGHGEFPRAVIAPGDANEAFYFAAEAMNLAWKFQMPVILLIDKHLSESTFTSNFDETSVKLELPKWWNGNGEYKKYLFEEDGVSPMAFPGNPNAIVKSNSYEHDEYGITVEDQDLVAKGHEKRLRKMKSLEEYLKNKETVKVYGNEDSDIVLVTWGSSKGAVVEVGEKLGLKVVQPLYMRPLPVWELKKHLEGKKVITVEVNSTGQFGKWLEYHGFKVHEKVLKYNARPFAADELEERIRKVIENFRR